VQQVGASIKWIFLGVFAFIAILLFVFRNKILQHPLVQKILHFLKGFSDGLLSIKQVKSPLLFILLSVGIWSCYVLMMYFCLFAMDATKELVLQLV
jgi:uncharacterized membrane protein YbhN (UPF0104 family)